MLASALRLTRIGFRALWFAAVLALLALTILPSLLRPAGFETYTVRGGSKHYVDAIASRIVRRPSMTRRSAFSR